ncbi:MAG: Golgi mannosyltransferase complex subunit [Chrysothrix sp. TS-e1954]|nr:MAG: Golgi mannosyltransferase complex subunit [Chrysothrix sp. TS-e1954]
MPTSRSLRRTNPIAIALGAILTLGVLIFLFTSSSTSSGVRAPTAAKLRLGSKEAASNFLSPPSLPFRKPKKPLERQPPPPVVHYHLNNVTTTADAIAKSETILILTPLSRYCPGYFENLEKLSYPHSLISIGFIIPKDAAGNAATKQLQEEIARIQDKANGQRFASITILRQDFDPPLMSQLESERHAMPAQKARRSAMARARNSLLFTTLGPTTSWVLWLDSDIVETPPSLIQDLASHDKPIIVPNCFQRYTNPDSGKPAIRPYDFNSWVDSESAQTIAKSMAPDDILLEGYAEMATYRLLMAGMYDPTKPGDPKEEVQLDGVGGTALLVKADVHRDGAMFPPFAFYHLIETEGFAKMAARLGWKSWGLPNYFVYHYNE